jgi:alkaline phosphatase
MTCAGLCARKDKAVWFALAASVSAVVPLSAAAAHPQQPDPPRVILLIADGTGIAHWTVGMLEGGQAVLRDFPVVGLVDTRNVDGRITDSGASATAYAAGLLTYNQSIGMGPDTLPVASILELAAERGLATGLVATSSIVHATPASFAAHVADRYEYEAIAAQMANSGLDVVLGGGRKFFDPSARDDGRDYLTSIGQGRQWVTSAEDLVAETDRGTLRLVGLFAETAMESADRGRSPTLAQMTQAALAALDRDPDGFVLMVEASQIDWLGHDNEPWERMAAEVLDCSETIQAVLEYVSDRAGALLVVTADHETGGLAVVDDDGAWAVSYAAGGHTAELVPLFASGAGSERFGGVHRIDEIGRILADIVLEDRPAD